MSNKIVLYNWGEPLMQQIDEDRIVHLCRWLRYEFDDHFGSQATQIAVGHNCQFQR